MLLTVVAFVLTGCAAGTSGTAPTGGGSPPPAATIEPAATPALCHTNRNPKPAPTGAVITTVIDLGCEAGGLAVAGGSVWVVPHLDRYALRIDPLTNSVAQVISLGNRGPGAEIDATDAMVWASVSTPSFDYERLVRIDPATGNVVAEVRVAAAFPVIGAGFVWATGEGGVSRIDPGTNTVAGTIEVRDCGVAILGTRVFCVGRDVTEIDPTADTAVRVPGAPDGFLVAADSGLIWGVSADSLWAFDPETGKIKVELEPPAGTRRWSMDAVVVDGSLWATATTGEGAPDRLVRIDRSDMTIDCVLEIPTSEFGMAAGLGSVWLPVLRQPYVVRIDPSC
jgi:DNA-binding beta-propeller fold protein YncE